MSGFAHKTYGTVQIGGPNTSFDEIRVAELTPVAQCDYAYGINTDVVNTITFAGGTVTHENGMASVNTGTGSTGIADVSLRRILKYRAGVGSLSRATAMFDTPIANTTQLVGPSNAECGYFFGYTGTNFGIFHFEKGQREIRKLTVSTGAGTGLVTVTLDGVSVQVPVTGGSNVNRTSYELARYDYSNVGDGWLADAIDGTVFFLSSRPSSHTGSYSVSGNSITGSFSSVTAGSGSSVTFIPQSTWNIDKMDGTGQSRMVLNPQKGNVYQIGFQYLGFGNAFFSIEDSKTGRPAPVHMIENTNNRTTPVLKNPQVTSRVVAINNGNTSNLSIKTVSMANFTEGKTVKLDPRYSHSFNYSAVNTAGVYQPIGALKVNRVFNSLTCSGELDLLRVGASNESTSKNLTVALFKGVRINGNVNFQYVNATNSTVSYAILTPGTDTITTNGAVPFLIFQVGSNNATSIDIIPDDFIIATGEVVVVAVSTTGPVSGDFTVNWYEQQ